MAYKIQRPQYYRKLVDMSPRLFTTCWRQYTYWLAGSIDNPESDDEVVGWLNQIAAERVNSSRSSFYIYGV
mgnify:FL=1|jgi:hypothetical protein